MVVPVEAPHEDGSEYRGNFISKNAMADMPDLEMRDLIMKKKFGASPDRYDNRIGFNDTASFDNFLGLRFCLD